MENRVETLPLKDQFKQALEEARVILPGIQALFGFQFVAIFNASFAKLGQVDQRLHLLALSLTALAVASAMAPAAIHRQSQPTSVSDRLVAVATWLLTFGMAPLAAGICLDFYIVSNVVLQDASVSRTLAIILTAIFATAWFAFPWCIRRSLKRVKPEKERIKLL